MEAKSFYYVLRVDNNSWYKEEIARYQNKSDAVNYAKLTKKMYPRDNFRVVKITETIVFSTKPTEPTELPII